MIGAYAALGAVTCIWLAVFVQYLRATRVLPTLSDGGAPSLDERVSVIIPARDEAEAIERTVRSLLAQDHAALEIIVVNDGSRDATGEIADALAREDERVRVVHDPPLRAGWLGKTNAMRAGVERATGAVLLFTDADIRFEPAAVRVALAELRRRDVALLSLFPLFRWVTVFEHMIGAAMFFALPQFGSPRLLDPAFPEAGAGVGAFMLITRAAYDDVGGHEACKSAIVDDIAFGRHVKRGGHRIWLAFAPALLSLRMYTSSRAALFALEKNVLATAGKRWWAIVLAPLALAPLLLAGPAAVAAGALAAAPALIAGGAALYLLQLATLQVLRRWQQFSFGKMALFPLVLVTLTVCVTRATWRYTRRGSVRWRGRDVKLTIEQ